MLLGAKSVAAIAVSVAVLFSLAVSTAKAEPKPKVRRVTSLKVVDANGKKVGYVFGGDLYYEEVFKPWIALKFGKQTVALRVERNLLSGTALLVFEGYQCSGQAYVTAALENQDLLPRAVIRPPGSTVYIGDPTESTRKIAGRSYSRRDGSCYSYSPPLGKTYYGRRAIPLGDLDTLYTPPFRIR